MHLAAQRREEHNKREMETKRTKLTDKVVEKNKHAALDEKHQRLR